MAWKSIFRRAGYNTKKVKDAREELVVGKIEKADLKDAVIGSPTRCSGAKLICRTLQAEMAWVGARVAVVAFNKNRLLRYEHNGKIPQQQDKGFFPLGKNLRLAAPPPTSRLGARKAYDAKRNDSRPTINKNRRVRGSTIAGEFRR